MRVCSTTHSYHYFFHPDPDALESVLRGGLRPLSDFPESDRWNEIETEQPGFYEGLYGLVAAEILQRPYENSGIFITPIDFRAVPGSFLEDKPRFEIPNERLLPERTVLTYVIGDVRTNMAFNDDTLQTVASLWDQDMVAEWFNVDATKAFFYVPQVAAYQGRIDVTAADYHSA